MSFVMVNRFYITIIFLLDFTDGSDKFIIVHPDRQIVTLNSTITLQCRVVPMKNIKVQWVKNGFGLGDTRIDIRQYGQIGNNFRYDLPNDLEKGQYDLQITNVNLQDEGEYYCQTSINNNAFTSRRASVQVLIASQPPKIFQITNQGKGPEKQRLENSPIVVDNGHWMVLRCQADRGRPGAALTWMIDNEQIDPDSSGNFNGIMSGSILSEYKKFDKEPKLRDTFSTLKAKVNQLLNGKSIQCSAINKGYEKFNLPVAKAKIEIHVAPTVTMEVQTQRLENEFVEHEMITISCFATGRPDKFTWRWYVNNNKVDNESRSFYKVKASRSLNKAIIKCVATNNKEGYSQQTINVKYGPQFLDISSPVYPVNIGDDVKLSCDSDSNPPSSIYWQKESSSDILGHGSTLYKKNVQESDIDIYICTATAEGFTPIFKKLYVAKRNKPFISENADRFVSLGKSIQIKCVINSIPEPDDNQIMWFHHGRRILGDNNKYTIFNERFLGGSNSFLNVNNIEGKDFGQYNCTVHTELGFDWKMMKLKKTSQIPMILIIGGTIFIAMAMLVVIIVICVCKKGICAKEYQKGSPTNKNDNSQDPLKNPQFEMDYQCQPNYYQWIPGSQKDLNKSTFVRYGQDMEDRSSLRNGSINQFRVLDMCSTYTSSIPRSQNGEKHLRNPEMEEMYNEEYYHPQNPSIMCTLAASACNVHPFSNTQHPLSLPQYNFTSLANSPYLSNYLSNHNNHFPLLPSYPIVHSPSSESSSNCAVGSVLPPIASSPDVNDNNNNNDMGLSNPPASFIKPGPMIMGQHMAQYLTPGSKFKQNPYNYSMAPNMGISYQSRTFDRQGPVSGFPNVDQTTNI